MSRFSVDFTERATKEFNAACDWYEQHSPQAAKKWLAAVGHMLDQLESDPHRFPRASDADVLTVPLQESYLGAGRRYTHRFVYAVRPDHVVVVYAIRHLAQDELTIDDF